MSLEKKIYGSRNSLKALVKGDNGPFCLPFSFCFLFCLAKRGFFFRSVTFHRGHDLKVTNLLHTTGTVLKQEVNKRDL